MNLIQLAKLGAERLPVSMGMRLSAVPYSLRLGPSYGRQVRRRKWFSLASPAERRLWILARMQRIVGWAYVRNPFYRQLYMRTGFSPEQLRTFEDIQRIPVVTKCMLNEWQVRRRSNRAVGRMLLNTGGTSGQPLAFFVPGNSFGKEWAHMHAIWRRVGYRSSDIKVTFRGRNLGADAVRYNATHNEFLVNAYKPFSVTCREIEVLAEQYDIRFLHGYPSAIYEFCRYVEDSNPYVVRSLRRSLRGVLLGSEYPAPVYRDGIDDVLRVPVVSWYGHSEMVVLAYEREKFVYEPMHSYGYCEAIDGNDGSNALVGTSYDNFVSPFIRYDTGDRVAAVEKDSGDMLSAFSISAGRVGDFVYDKDGHPISLTALIFGRHHRIFDYAQFVQIAQQRKGSATVVVTLRKGCDVQPDRLCRDFDSSGINMQCDFVLRQDPVRTESGKVPLLLSAGLLRGGLISKVA